MMRKWSRAFPVLLESVSSWLLLAAFCVFLLPQPLASGQILIPAEAVAGDEAEVEQALQRGHEFEAQQRWGEALSHYEQVVREYPQRRDLRERLTRARVHYDLARRYDDPSYLDSLASLNETAALDLYSEVLGKIGSHYVQPPDWQELAERGLANLDIALMQSSFRRRNALQASDQTLQAFMEHIRRRMEVTQVRTQQQAREVAANVARAASERLALPPVATILEFTCGAACSLDQYSGFLTRAQLQEVFNQIEGNFIGLGIELQPKQQSLEIVSVIPGSPAEQAGVQAGDKIVEVDATPTSSVSADEAAEMLKGSEGSSTELKLVDARGTTRRVRLVRRRVEVPSVEQAHLVDAELGTAYLKLTSFQKTTSREVDTALWNLHRQGMRTLIIDLRKNPGGLLEAAVEVADKFVVSGNIVATRGRNAHEDCDRQAHSLGTWRVPLVVLIDADTASASEIFAGAIRDHRRGTVIGQRSYGKGSVQGIFSLNTTGAGVRLTTAKFYSPSGQAISDQGISPDLLVQTVLKPTDDLAATTGDDATLQAALDYVRHPRQPQQEARAR